MCNILLTLPCMRIFTDFIFVLVSGFSAALCGDLRYERKGSVCVAMGSDI